MSRVGMAAGLLRDGKAPEDVARTMRMTLPEVQSIAREVEARKAKEAEARKPRKPVAEQKPKPYLRTQYSEKVRAELVPPAKRGKDYSPEEDAHLKELVEAAFTHVDIAAIIGRPYYSVTRRCHEIKAKAPVGPRASIMVRAIYQARYYLRRDDALTALHLLEEAIKAKEAGQSG